ncbi:MAG: AAA family ATPase [Anaerolineae bacterium]|nr:AAA family ATPase [Anaerolineae bacterium]
MFSIIWSLLATLVGISLFFLFSPAGKSLDLSFSSFRSYFAWPPLGLSIIIIYTIISACLYLSLSPLAIEDVTNILASYTGLFALLSLSVIGQLEQKEILKEVITPSDPIILVSIHFLLMAFLVPFAVSTSLYTAASDVGASKLKENHILGILSPILLVYGIFSLVHKIGLLGFSYLENSNNVFLQLGFTVFTFLSFSYYVIILLQTTTEHAKQNKLLGIRNLLVFNFLNLLLHLLAISILWLISSTVYEGLSANGTWIAKAAGLLISGIAFLVIGFVLFVIFGMGIYDSNGLIMRYYWTIHIEIILQDSFQLKTPQEFKSFFKTTLVQVKKSQSTKAHKKLMGHLSNYFCDFYSSKPRTAIDILAQLPAYTGAGDDDLWVPILNRILDDPKNDHAEIVNQLIGKFFKAGLLERVAQHLKGQPLFHNYYQLTTVGETEFEKTLIDSLVVYKKFPKVRNLHQIYEMLAHFNSLSTFKDIVNLPTNKLAEINFRENTTTSQLERFINAFPIIVSNARKSEQVALEHKLPYFANSLELLNNAASSTTQLSQPHQRVVTFVLRKWQSIITTELMSLKGRAELNIELKLQKFYVLEKLIVPIEIQNIGNSVAEDIKIELVSNGKQFKVLDFDFNELDILAPHEKIIVNFSIAPQTSGKIRIAIETTFTDFDAAGKIHKFADIIEVVNRNISAIEHESDYTVFLNNPYIPGRPIRTPQMFFGRQNVLATIEQSLMGRHQDNVIVLQGERRSGKTSILYYLLAKFKDDYVPVLIDAQGILSRGTEYFIWQFASIIQEQLHGNGILIPPPNLETAKKEAEVWLKHQFLSTVRNVLNGRKLLILFDEFDSLEDRIREGNLDKEIFPLFRNLMQHEDWLAFIFSGTHRLEEMVTEYWSILFNIAIYIRLDFLTEQDARSLITTPVSGLLEYDEFAIERILAVSSQHPYFVQLICFLLYNLHAREGNNYITSQDVDRIIDEVIDTQAHTHFIWKDTSHNEHFVLAALAQEAKQENNVVTPIMIRNVLVNHKIDVGKIDVNDTLTTLTRKGILKSDSTVTQFSFRVELVRRWLRRYKSLGSIIDEEGR